MKAEAIIQKQIVAALKPFTLRHRFIVLSIPNEGILAGAGARRSRAYATVNAFKQMGMLPGASDLMIYHDGRALFLEVKTDTGSLTPAERAFKEDVHRCSQGRDRYRVARTVPEAVAIVGQFVGFTGD